MKDDLPRNQNAVPAGASSDGVGSSDIPSAAPKDPEVAALHQRVQRLSENCEALQDSESNLRRSWERFRRLSEAAVEGLCIHHHGIILDANESFAKLFGYELSELIGADGYCLFPAHCRAEAKARIQEESEEPYETVGLRKDGSTFPVEIHTKHILVQGFRARVAAIRDITERQQAEQARLHWETKLLHAQKLESLEALAGGVAHDFNNLLTVILGHASLAESLLEEHSPARASLEAIKLASQRATRLANQMLAYSGKSTFVLNRLNLAQLIEEMSQAITVSMLGKAVLRYELDTEMPDVQADTGQVRQLILSLITNAAEAIGDQPGVVSVKTRYLHADPPQLPNVELDEPLPEGLYAYIEVADTGCGMNNDTRERMFDPFFTTKEVGRGLGLAAALGIVRGHQGTISVDTSRGAGTTIRAFFPAVASTIREPEPPAPTHMQPNPTERERILIVDDEPLVLDVTRGMLQRDGFEVHVARNGAEAVDVVREKAEELTLVLLDMTMPVMDGEEAFGEIRRIAPNLPVILASGFTEQDAMNRFKNDGLAAFLQKPFNFSTLIAEIRQAIAQNGANRKPV